MISLGSGLARWLSGKESACQAGVRKILCRRKWQPAPVFLPETSHGQRSLVGYSPWDQKSLTRLSDLTTTAALVMKVSETRMRVLPQIMSQRMKLWKTPRGKRTWEEHWDGAMSTQGFSPAPLWGRTRDEIQCTSLSSAARSTEDKTHRRPIPECVPCCFLANIFCLFVVPT